MSIETSLHKHLISLQAVNDLVGQKVSPLRSKADVGEPRVIYEQIAGSNFHDLGGTSGVNRGIYQISCFGESYSQAKAVADAIRGIDGYRGWFGGDSVATGGTWVQMAKVEDSNDDAQPPIDASDEELSVVLLDVLFIYDS